MARYYGYGAREVGRLSVPQIEGYMKRLPDVLEIGGNASAAPMLMALAGR